jgi:hypothetical protein
MRSRHGESAAGGTAGRLSRLNPHGIGELLKSPQPAGAEVAAAAGMALLICCPLGRLALDGRLARGSRRGP